MRLVALMGGVVAAVLVAFASGYGYHRDELYFIAAGEHLAWGYPDQGPLTPFIARAMTGIAPDSLTMLRLPSALAAGAIVVLTGLLARDLGGSRRAQLLAAACAAVASIVLITGHLLSTTTFDLLVWTALTWLIVRAIRFELQRLWPVAGLVLGIGLLNKPLPAFLAVALLAGVLVTGPRRLLRSRYVWTGAAIAVLLWSPWLVWQASNGWPQIDVAQSVAGGESTSAEPWWAIVPFQFLLVSPVLAPVWIAGLVRLFRDPGVRDLRCLGWTWVVLVLLFTVTAGKPYYIAGLLPLLLAAGAPAIAGWLERGGPRPALVLAALALSAVINLTLALPVLPVDKTGPVLAMNEDVGETIGWPDFARTVARVHDGLGRPPGAVVLTSNYGQAGAVDRFGSDLGLPRAYSGHNAYGDQGPPPAGAAPVIVVGLADATLQRLFRGCRPAARVDNAAGVDNEERGRLVSVCAAPRMSWAAVWPELRRYG